jgi:predicted regulator of Ras-like GTPase activity (Roadblock/LC7/MglB family)
MTQARTSLDWLLKDLPGDVPGTRHVVVLSADGLRIAQHTTDDDAADRISAACSGLQSLATAIAAEFPGGNRSTRLIAIECASGYFSMMAAGPGAYLAVLADRGTDPGLLGDRMRDLVARIGDHLASPPRSGAPAGW